MNNLPLIIGILVGIIIVAFTLLIVAKIYQNRTKKKNSQQTGNFFDDFHYIVYSAIFSNKLPEDVAAKFGINAEEYYNNCKTVGIKPDIIRLVAKNIYGLAMIIVGAVLMVSVNHIFGIMIMVLGLLLMMMEKSRLKSKAEERKQIIAEQLPDFLDLLKTELVVGIPVELAIFNICERKDNLLSQEFFRTMQDMQLGASDWSSAMEEMADRYDIEILTDFVLEVSTAYKNGTPVADAVIRKAEDIRTIHLLNIKEKASKITNTILLPMTILQIVPMLAFIMFPMVLGMMGESQWF